MEFMRGKKSDHDVANCVCPPAQPKDDADNGDHQGDSLPNPHPTLPRKEDQCINALRLCSQLVLHITGKCQYKLVLCSDSWYPIVHYIHRLISAHKHRLQRWSQKKINQFMLSGCVHAWCSSTVAGTNPNWCCVQTFCTE